MTEEVKQTDEIIDTLESLVGKRFNKSTLELELSQAFGVDQKLDDVSRDDDELSDYNLMGSIDREKNDVHIYAYYDIYFLKMRTEGFDGSDIYITEVGIEFE